MAIRHCARLMLAVGVVGRWSSIVDQLPPWYGIRRFDSAPKSRGRQGRCAGLTERLLTTSRLTAMAIKAGTMIVA